MKWYIKKIAIIGNKEFNGSLIEIWGVLRKKLKWPKWKHTKSWVTLGENYLWNPVTSIFSWSSCSIMLNGLAWSLILVRLLGNWYPCFSGLDVICILQFSLPSVVGANNKPRIPQLVFSIWYLNFNFFAYNSNFICIIKLILTYYNKFQG